MNKTINWYEKDLDETLDTIYNRIEEGENSFEFFKYLMVKFPELEIDWLEIFEDIQGDLLMQERIDDILFFINWYNKKFPEDYSCRYEFIERDLCSYYLYKKEYKLLEKRIDFIQKNPVPGIDTVTIPLLFQLIYQGQYQQAVTFSEHVWKPIDESTELMGHAAYNFAITIYLNNLQKYYESVLNNSSFNTDIFFDKMVELGFSNDKEWFIMVIEAVKSDLDMELVNTSIKEKKNNYLPHLNIQFLKYMYNQFNFSFIFSEQIWQFVGTDKIFGKHGKQNWFYISAKTMDQHIIENYDTFLGSNKLQVFGNVWGFDYIISFFKHAQLITSDQFQIMLENNLYFKRKMTRIAGSDLWKMMFVFDWPEIDDGIKSKFNPGIFKSTFGLNEYEDQYEVKEHLSTIPVNDRISRELKKKKSSLVEPSMSPLINSNSGIGRNSPCPCGSGKKYKKCCLNDV